ncbi:MAG: MCE family protein [Victivallales bacterium]|nr:MCE family protein [Victivallales bacterium]
MKQRSVECLVGLFVILGCLCFAYLSIRFARMEVGGGKEYQIHAVFADLGGLRAGAAVEIAGVPVGRVVSLDLDEHFAGRLVLSLKDRVRIPTDTVAAVKTKGLIGEKFVGLSPGNGNTMVEAGGWIGRTESGSMELPFTETNVAGGEHYELTATFTHLGGLRVGASIEVAGVPIGRVREIELDERYNAQVVMDIKDQVKLSADTFASIRTKGLIGGKYILLEPGGDDQMLADGDEIEETEPAVDIESIISGLVQGKIE